MILIVWAKLEKNSEIRDMAVSFGIARLDDELSASSTPGWAVVRHEAGQPSMFVSRIFIREQDAVDHAQRLTMREAARTRKDRSSN